MIPDSNRNGSHGRIVVPAIGVIYGGGARGVPVAPTFLTEGYSTPTFQDENVKNLLAPEAICGDQITIKPFSAPPRTPLQGELITLSQTPELMRMDTSSPLSSPFASRPKGASFSNRIGTPTF